MGAARRSALVYVDCGAGWQRAACEEAALSAAPCAAGEQLLSAAPTGEEEEQDASSSGLEATACSRRHGLKTAPTKPSELRSLSPSSLDDFSTATPAEDGEESCTDHVSDTPNCEWSCSGKKLGAVAGGVATTIMMRNVPRHFSRDGLRLLLDSEGFSGKYDFIYLPKDFRTSVVRSFAFVNFVSPVDAEQFREHFTRFRRWGVATGKTCNVSWARPDQQGLRANIERFRNSSVMHRSVAEECRPLLLVAGIPTTFPKNTKKLWPPHPNFGTRASRGSA